MDRADANEPIEAIESAEPMDPIESTEPRDPMHRIESWDQSDHFDPEPGAGRSRVVSERMTNSVPGRGVPRYPDLASAPGRVRGLLRADVTTFRVAG